MLPVKIGSDGGTLETDLGLEGTGWDEFTGNASDVSWLRVILSATVLRARHADFYNSVIGAREIRSEGNRLLLNGRPLFLRGTLECCIFPLTGHPPTDVDSWKRIIASPRRTG